MRGYFLVGAVGPDIHEKSMSIILDYAALSYEFDLLHIYLNVGFESNSFDTVAVFSITTCSHFRNQRPHQRGHQSPGLLQTPVKTLFLRLPYSPLTLHARHYFAIDQRLR